MTKKQDKDAKVDEVEKAAEVSAEPQDAVETTPAEETPEAPAEEAVAETAPEEATKEAAPEVAVGEAPAEKVEETTEAVSEDTAVVEEEPVVEAEPVAEAAEEVAPEAELTEEAAPSDAPIDAPSDTPDVSQGKRALMNDLFAEIKTLKQGELPEDQEVTSKEAIAYQELLDHAVIDLDQQSLVQARIISVSDKEVMVDFGFKSEGLVPRHEFDEIGRASCRERV